MNLVKTLILAAGFLTLASPLAIAAASSSHPSLTTVPSSIVIERGGAGLGNGIILVARQGADDPADHDVGDDNGGGGHGADDPADHDVGDDNGGHGADDPADHDVGDDNGGNGVDDPADHDVGDDNGARRRLQSA